MSGVFRAHRALRKGLAGAAVACVVAAAAGLVARNAPNAAGDATRASTGRVERTPARSEPQARIAAYGSRWTLDFAASTVSRWNPHSGEEVARIALTLPRPIHRDDDRFLPFDLAAGAGSVWVSTARGYVARIDPATNERADLIATAPDATGAVAAGDRAVWVAEGVRLARLDPTTLRLTRHDLGDAAGRKLAIASLTITPNGLRVRGEWARASRGPAGHPEFTLTSETARAVLDPVTGEPREIE